MDWILTAAGMLVLLFGGLAFFYYKKYSKLRAKRQEDFLGGTSALEVAMASVPVPDDGFPWPERTFAPMPELQMDQPIQCDLGGGKLYNEKDWNGISCIFQAEDPEKIRDLRALPIDDLKKLVVEERIAGARQPLEKRPRYKTGLSETPFCTVGEKPTKKPAKKRKRAKK